MNRLESTCSCTRPPDLLLGGENCVGQEFIGGLSYPRGAAMGAVLLILAHT